MRTSWIAALAVPFTSCHLKVPPHNRKVAEGNLFRHRCMTFTNYSVLCMLSCVLRHALQCGENSKSCEGLFPFSSALLRKSTKSCWVDV